MKKSQNCFTNNGVKQDEHISPILFAFFYILFLSEMGIDLPAYNSSFIIFEADNVF